MLKYHAQTKILIEENMLIGKPIELISNWRISMYLRMVIVQELAQASPGQITMFLNGKFQHFKLRFFLAILRPEMKKADNFDLEKMRK